MYRVGLDNNWKMHKVGSDELINAVVPGSVYTDLLREGKMEDPFFKDNEDKALKLMDEDYEYELSFDVSKYLLGEDHLILHFDGLDTICDIALNGKHIASTCNMHRTYEFEVKEYLVEKENKLSITFHSPTKFVADAYAKAPTKGSEDAMQGFVHLRKGHYMFGWDWGAHLPDAGIFRPVSLLAYSGARLNSVNIIQEHEDGNVTLTITPDVVCDNDKAYAYIVKITDPEGNESVYKDSPKTIKIESPKLWWPNGYGEHPLYTVEVQLLD